MENNEIKATLIISFLLGLPTILILFYDLLGIKLFIFMWCYLIIYILVSMNIKLINDKEQIKKQKIKTEK